MKEQEFKKDSNAANEEQLNKHLFVQNSILQHNVLIRKPFALLLCH